MCIKGGYILQPRAVDESDIMHEPPIVRELWFYILRKVNHDTVGKFTRGTGFFNLGNIAEDLHWYSGYRKMKYSKPQITKSLRKLRGRNMVETTEAMRGMFITVCKYDFYQDPNNYGGNDGETTEEMRKKSKGHAKNKNDKNERSNNSLSEKSDNSKNSFDNFRKMYLGTKRGLDVEYTNFIKKNKPEIIELLMPALLLEIQYRDALKLQNAFVPEWKNLSTWLNQKCWTQELPEVTPKSNGRETKFLTYSEMMARCTPSFTSENFECTEIEGQKRWYQRKLQPQEQ